jgi:GPI-anchor transamidase subunit S
MHIPKACLRLLLHDQYGVQIDTLPNLEIPRFIGDKVLAAKVHAQAAVAAAAAGNYTAAVGATRAARVAAEKAATHHAIVSQHAYPEQHKVALYLPLFAPLALPLVGAFAAEVKHALGRSRLR